jgi:hypothetical protein
MATPLAELAENPTSKNGNPQPRCGTFRIMVIAAEA